MGSLVSGEVPASVPRLNLDPTGFNLVFDLECWVLVSCKRKSIIYAKSPHWCLEERQVAYSFGSAQEIWGYPSGATTYIKRIMYSNHKYWEPEEPLFCEPFALCIPSQIEYCI